MIAIDYNPLNRKRIHESILVYIKKERNGEKKKLFLTMVCHLMNVGGIMESENHQFATMIVIINSGKKHQWMC